MIKKVFFILKLNQKNIAYNTQFSIKKLSILNNMKFKIS